MKTDLRANVLAVPLAALLLACGSEPSLAPGLRPDSAITAERSERHSEWSDPINLGLMVNSEFNELTPEMSPDGRSLYFASDRPGGRGGNDLWVSRRSSGEMPWGAPVNLGPVINTEGADAAPHLTRDGHRLYFSSEREPGNLDIWVSWRDDTRNDFAWSTPVNLGPNVNGPSFDAGANLWRLELYFASDRGSANGQLDIYLSERKSHGGFRAAALVEELSSAANDQRPSVDADGREMFLSSNRPGSRAGSTDIWTAKRRSGHGRWSRPVNLGVSINTEFLDQQPALSKDGSILHFASNRPGGSGGLDLYAARRDNQSSRQD
jgi:Tol biopolymer transport system component